MKRKKQPRPVAGARQEATKVDNSNGYLSPTRHKQQAGQRTRPPHRKPVSVTDGTITVGICKPYGWRQWRAFTADGIEVGIFDDLKTAMAAMPEKGSRRAFSHEEPRASIDDLRAAGKARRGEP